MKGMEIEQWKCVLVLLSAAAAKVGGSYLGMISDGDLTKYFERGGTVLSLAILLYGLRYLRDKVEAREKQIEARDAQIREIMQKDREIHEKATESRVKLNCTIEKQSNALDKQSEAIREQAEAIKELRTTINSKL